MSALSEYVTSHTITNQESVELPEPSIDMIFFKVAASNNPNADDLKALIQAHSGEFNKMDLFDNDEHNYIKIGGWIGDQGMALRLMALGTLLNMWTLLSPKNVLPGIDEVTAARMAGTGMLSIVVPKQE